MIRLISDTHYQEKIRQRGEMLISKELFFEIMRTLWKHFAALWLSSGRVVFINRRVKVTRSQQIKKW